VEGRQLPGQAGKCKDCSLFRGCINRRRAASNGRSRTAAGRARGSRDLGLTEHIRDVTRRVAKAGFVALGIDLLSRQGGTRPSPTIQLAQAYGRTVQTERHEDMVSGVDYLKNSRTYRGPHRRDRVLRRRREHLLLRCYNGLSLQAAVPFYGTPPNPLPAAERVTTALLASSRRTTGGRRQRISALSDSLVAARVTFGITCIQGTNHAFQNPARL